MHETMFHELVIIIYAIAYVFFFSFPPVASYSLRWQSSFSLCNVNYPRPCCENELMECEGARMQY